MSERKLLPQNCLGPSVPGMTSLGRDSTDLYLLKLYLEQRWRLCQEEGQEGQIRAVLLPGKSAQQKMPHQRSP